ncbi:MAG TPA: hypothetical protein VFT22_04675 [Kofleriaceae bacterium]|nr:hypothetical protein [Kofleriaceae bacterium]
MQPLVTHPQAAVADAIPAGVASPDGRIYYVATPRGIEALDAATGAVAWSTAAAGVPVIALADTLLAIRGAAPFDGSWLGAGTPVAIDVAAPHATRTGAPFELPLARHRLDGARIAGGALVAAWRASTEDGGGPVREPLPDVEGSIHLDLATGAARITEGAALPESVRQVLASAGQWTMPWRTRDGWSALVIGGLPGAQSMTLSHWPDAGASHTTLLLDGLDLRTTRVLHVNARHAFVRTCDLQAPERCELRVHDAETGAPAATFADPLPAQISPPFALIGRDLLAVEHATTRGAPGRALVAFAPGAPAPRWRHPIAPEPFVPPRP